MNARAAAGWQCLWWLALILPPASHASEPVNELRFEIPALPGYQRHVALLEYPGYIGVALENNDLHPTLSSKMIVRERGREVQVKNGVLRFTGRNATSYVYEAGLALGVGNARVTFPVTVDVSALASGKALVAAKLPLAALIPNAERERIEANVRMLGSGAAQQKVLDYLDRLTKSAGPDDPIALGEAILLDAYNRSGGAAGAGRDVGDAVPLSEQWMLLLTLAIWLIIVPALLVMYRLRRPKGKPVVR